MGEPIMQRPSRTPVSHLDVTRSIYPEGLERRLLLAAAVRSYDGTGNNLQHAGWGAAGAPLIRLALGIRRRRVCPGWQRSLVRPRDQQRAGGAPRR
jgi:hypothetical protein